MSNTVEHERTANALLLFYEKVRPREFPPDENAETAKNASTGSAANDPSSSTPTMAQPKSDGDPAGREADTAKENSRMQIPSSVSTARMSSSSSSSLSTTLETPASDSGGGKSCSNSGGIGAEAKGDHPDNMSTSTESDLEGGGEEKSSVPPGAAAIRRPVVKPGRPDSGSRGGVGKTVTVSLLDGVETYSEEVWQANVQFMLNSYVFDTEFHQFLRRVYFIRCVCMPFNIWISFRACIEHLPEKPQ